MRFVGTSRAMTLALGQLAMALSLITGFDGRDRQNRFDLCSMQA